VRAVSHHAQGVPRLDGCSLRLARRVVGRSPTAVAVEHLAAVLVAATVADLTRDHHEVDRSLVRAIHVEVDLARGIDATLMLREK
jgi:hypothetical protein